MQRKKRRTNTTLKQIESNNVVSVESDSTDIVGGFDSTEFNWILADSLNLVDPISVNEYVSITPPSFESTPTLLNWPIDESSKDMLRPWYLELDSWKLQHHTKDPDCAIEVNYDPYVSEVRSMLRSWSTTGCNTFIHRKLYESGMPRCIQEAFTMISAYFHCSSDMKSAVMQIAEDNSCRLAQRKLPNTGDGKQILDHLSRVHALFVYVFVRLFDGSIRLRASAEKQIPLLRSWIAEMVEEATRLESISAKTGGSAVQRELSALDAEFQTMSEQWETWIVAESVRRSHVIINTILNVYLCLSVGQAECSGFLQLTARHGLWQAESATRWSRIVSCESPLLISIANPGRLIAEHSAHEFDEIVQLLWKYIVGPERIQRWVENSKDCMV